MTRANVAVIVSVIVFLTTAAWAQTPTETPTETAAPDNKLPDGPGKSVFVKICSDCHAPESAVSMLRTREEWTTTLGAMAQFGAQGTDEEFQQVLDYLLRNFSPIQVNQATAKDLETALDVPTKVAEAIVSYRQENGSFKSPDDLKKVPGLETSKVDARKHRLVF